MNVTWRKVNLLMKHVRKFGRRYVFLFMLGMITEIYLNSPLECACVTIILIGYFLNILPHKNIGIVIYVVTFIIGILFERISNFLEKTYYNDDYFLIIMFIVVLIRVESLLSCAYIKYKISNYHCSWNKKNVFAERNLDLNRLDQWLIDTNTFSLGVEAPWGEGKTFLINGLIEKHFSDEYVFITVDVLSIRVENLFEFLLSELNNVLEEEGIISNNYRKLKSLLEKSKVNFLAPFMSLHNMHYSKVFDDFKLDLEKTGKIVVLIYEDLDRIEDKVAIKNIFYITEKLSYGINESKPLVKAIYQYSASELTKIGIDYDYQEKYIQNRFSLTQIDFYEMIRTLQSKVDDEAIYKLTEDDVCRLPPVLIVGDGLLENRDCDKLNCVAFFADRLTVRRTKRFLETIKRYCVEFNRNFINEQRDVLISVCFIEHFMPNIYEKIKNNALENIFKIESFQNEKISLFDSLDLEDSVFINKINPKEYPENFEIYVAWRLLGFSKYKKKEKRIISSEKDYYREDIDEFKHNENLEIADIKRMISYMIEAGKPDTNDYISHAELLVKTVLNEENASRRKDKFSTWIKQMTYGNHGIGSICRYNLSIWSNIFRGFYLSYPRWSLEDYEKNCLNLLKLYKQLHDKHFFSIECVKECIAVWEMLMTPAIYIAWTKYIENLEVKGNMNDYDLFYVFVSRSFYAMYRNGFIMDVEPQFIEDIKYFDYPSDCFGKAKLYLIDICKKIESELNRKIKVLKRNKGCILMGEDYYFILLSYVKFIKNVIEDKREQRDETEDTIVRIIDRSGEEYDRVYSIQDIEELKKELNNSNTRLTYAQKIDILWRKEEE